MIDYGLLAKGVDFYKRAGFDQVEVPWMIDPKFDALTRPKQVKPFHVKRVNKNLCGSGEQGLLQISKKLIENYRYFTVTPCFRDDKPDKVHRTEFMKIELGVKTSNIDSACNEVENFRQFALTLFHNLCWGSDFRSRWSTWEREYNRWSNVDIEVNGIEIGSYGFRRIDDNFCWTYGTGLALPRFTIATEKK